MQLPKPLLAGVKMYRIETHMHTSQASACAHNTGAEMARLYKEKGYDGIIITDHFFNGNSCIPSRLPWDERISLFCSGFEDAKAEGERIGLDVYFGWEYGGDGGMEFLTYGLDKEWLLNHPELLSLPIREYLSLVRRDGGFVSQAHPFREAFYIGEPRLYPDLTEGAEVINSSHKNPKFNLRAAEYARENGLIATAGSDSHSYEYFFNGGMLFDNDIHSIEEFIAELRAGRYKLIE